MSKITISKETIKRLISDVKALRKDPLVGIYYRHDENDLLKGKAMIIGPENTPYAGGYYFFKFSFPCDYPHSPPVVKFGTNDGSTRFHPNLYRTGKVCLSILNTWKGDPWTGCQTISSVLLTIQSLLTNDPFLHEPGITKFYRDFYSYSEIIRFKNILFSTLGVIQEIGEEKEDFKELIIIAQNDFIDNFRVKKEIYQESLHNFNKYMTKSKNDSHLLSVELYKMRENIDYEKIYCLYDLIKEKILLTKLI